MKTSEQAQTQEKKEQILQGLPCSGGIALGHPVYRESFGEGKVSATGRADITKARVKKNCRGRI